MNNSPSVPVYDSTHRAHPALEELHEVLHFRHLILQLVRRDVLTRYKRSFLGIAWTMLNPLGMMLVWTIAFSQVFNRGGGADFAAYMLNGLLAWLFFSQTTTASMVNFVWGGGLLHRIYMPRTSFALAACGTGLINLVLSLVPLLGVMLVTGVPLHWSALITPLTMLVLAMFSLGAGLLLATFAVYFPDVSEMYQIVLQAWMFLTPIMYPEEILPAAYRFWITKFNPMYYLVRLYRIPLYYGRLPGVGEWLPSVLLALVVFLIGWLAFTSKSDEYAYRL
jgi:homopolymeric O-antigen transport system permease protein